MAIDEPTGRCSMISGHPSTPEQPKGNEVTPTPLLLPTKRQRRFLMTRRVHCKWQSPSEILIAAEEAPL